MTVNHWPILTSQNKDGDIINKSKNFLKRLKNYLDSIEGNGDLQRCLGGMERNPKRPEWRTYFDEVSTKLTKIKGHFIVVHTLFSGESSYMVERSTWGIDRP